MDFNWQRAARGLCRQGFVLTALCLLTPDVSHDWAQALPAKPAGDAGKQILTKPAPNELDAELKNALKNAPTSTQWPEEDYARLLDLGDVTIKPDGTTVATYRVTYKLFNERARNLAEVSLPYNSSSQSLKVISARTIKKDGTVVNVRPEDIRISAPYSDYLMYDDAVAAGFSMPGIEDDCVIDYTYEMVTRPMLLPGQFWTYWGFSGPEPVVVSRYTLHTPADKPLKFKMYNTDSLQPTVVSSPDKKTKTYTWEMSHINPIAVEPSMPDVSKVRAWMEVSSLDSWQDISKWFWGLEKPQAAPTDAIRATVKQLTEGKTTDDAKAGAIYDWVANHTRYVGLEFGISAFKPHAASAVYDNLYGDCKDKATLLITMLGLAGIKAHPVLLHAEDRTPVGSRLPSLEAFNHCIALAEVGGKEVWLDATAETCAYGDIPAGDRGVEALVVREGTGKFETIPTYSSNENGADMATHVTLHADGSADVDNQIQWRGAASQEWRGAIRAVTPDKRRQIMEKIAQSFSTGATVKDFTLPDSMEKTGPFVMKMSIPAPHWAKKTKSLLLLPVSGWLSSPDRRNPYTQEHRFWPIVTNDTSQTKNVTTISVPDGYTVEELPEDVNQVSPLEEYHRKITASADGKTLTITEISTEKAGTVPVANYADVKGFYDTILKSSGDLIVLLKK